MKHLDILETLLAEHGKLQAIVESSINGIVELDTEGRLLSLNPAARRIFNLPRAAPPEGPINDLVDLPELQEMMEKLSRKKEEILQREVFFNLSLPNSKVIRKFLEIKIIAIPRKNDLILTLIITDKTDIIRALENREEFISTLINLIEELRVDSRAIIYNLARLVEIRDARTGKHLERVEAFTRILGYEYQKHYREEDSRITDDYVEDMALSSVLHDIGKIGISDTILQKPGQLSPYEFDIIKNHTLIAGEALLRHRGKKDFLAMGREISLNHHEKWDGTGYPRGLKGNEIPLSGRIVALCDVYDALTSERPYKTAFSHQTAVDIITKDRGKAFDPRIVDLFLNVHQAFDQTRREFEI